MAALHEIARAVLSPLEAPAGYTRSELIGPDEPDEPSDEDVAEWVTLDAAVARRMAAGGQEVVLRVGPGARALAEAPRQERLAIEAQVVDAESANALESAIRGGLRVRAALATGDTGIDAYRAAAAARQVLGLRVPIRVRWDGCLDVKGAALALTFGADELAGPLAPRVERLKLAQLGGPAEDVGRPSPAFVESLIRAAGRLPVRR